LDYWNKNHLSPIKFVEDTVSGKIVWQDRMIGQIIEKATTDDIIVVSEISRLGRSTLQVLEILELAAKKQVSVHIAKNHIVVNGSMQSTILGLAAQIERRFNPKRLELNEKQMGLNLADLKDNRSCLNLILLLRKIKEY
jgi:DNA invertase Pin-like site-specific DNA recombinase